MARHLGLLDPFLRTYMPGPGVIVFQDLDDPSAAATFGEVMCTTYKAFGAYCNGTSALISIIS